MGDDPSWATDIVITYLSRGEHDDGTVSTAVISLGYLANRGSERALRTLLELTVQNADPRAEWAMNGLALSGHPAAKSRLQELLLAVVSRREHGYGRTTPQLSDAVEAHSVIALKGLRAYYSGR
jgi:hypothetical protein